MLFSCSKESKRILSDLEQSDFNGKLKSVELFEFDKKGEQIIVKYDESGFIYQTEYLLNDSLRYSEKIIRDSNHRIISVNTIIQDTIYKSLLYVYENNLVIQMKQIVGSSVHKTWDYELDSEGNKTKELITNNRSEQRIVTYSNPSPEIEISRIFNESGELFQKIEIETDTSKGITESLFTTYISPQISTQYQTIIEVDSVNNLMKLTNDGTDIQKEIFTYMYEFDSLNNWVIQYVYKDNNFQGINERTFKYYKH
jgi:hypothetical protein